MLGISSNDSILVYASSGNGCNPDRASTTNNIDSMDGWVNSFPSGTQLDGTNSYINTYNAYLASGDVSAW